MGTSGTPSPSTTPAITDAMPHLAQPKPFKVELEKDKSYYYCSCGLSKNQPWCDGSHKGTGYAPKQIKVKESGTYFMCGCKLTHDADGFCDGTHRKEEGIQRYNKFLLKANSDLRSEVDNLKYKNQKMKLCAWSILSLGTAVVAALAFKLKQ